MTKYVLPMLLALCCTNAYAKAVAYIPNQGGGRITFTDQPCQIGKTVGAMAYTSNKGDDEPHMGCWNVSSKDASRVHVQWVDLPIEVAYKITDLRRLDPV